MIRMFFHEVRDTTIYNNMFLFCGGTVAQSTPLPHTCQHIRHNIAVCCAGAEVAKGGAYT